MAIGSPNYVVNVFNASNTYDVADRCLGFTTSCDAGIGELGRMSAVVTLDNSDGALTPASAGGTGTYANVDFFTMALQIRAYVPQASSTYLFFGLINGVDFDDNGVTSRATFYALDVYSLAGRGNPTNITELAGTTDTETLRQLVERVYYGGFGAGDGIEMPEIGYADAFSNTQLIGGGDDGLASRPAATAVNPGDYVSTFVLPAGPCLHFPGRYLTVSGDISYTGYISNRGLSKDSNLFFAVDDFDFSDNASGSTFPIGTIVNGFTNDLVTSRAEVTCGITGSTTQTVTDTATSGKYGQRTRTYASVAARDDANALKAASFWVNRQSTVRYTPRVLTTTLRQCQALASNENKFSRLLAFEWIVGANVKTTYTPTGGSSTSTVSVVIGRTIEATPNDTTITLRLLPAADYASLTLDSSYVGQLDTYRVA